MKAGDETDDKMSINVTKYHLDGQHALWRLGQAQFVVDTMLS